VGGRGDRIPYRGEDPLRRLGEPVDIGTVAVFLGSDASRYITGQTIVVDGGVVSAGV
jgi:NAD(P)-dependent dehydrogenase (short-subunit alcohol dehydrogenase family)